MPPPPFATSITTAIVTTTRYLHYRHRHHHSLPLTPFLPQPPLTNATTIATTSPSTLAVSTTTSCYLHHQHPPLPSLSHPPPTSSQPQPPHAITTTLISSPTAATFITPSPPAAATHSSRHNLHLDTTIPSFPLPPPPNTITSITSSPPSRYPESGEIKVEGRVRDGVPHLKKIGGFEVDVSFTTQRKQAIMVIGVDGKPSNEALKKIDKIPAVEEFVFLTGYVFILNGGDVDWKNTKQSIFATSYAETEYIAALDASKEEV
nr:hypothetical protein [Tanacetum cinerariifolium]